MERTINEQTNSSSREKWIKGTKTVGDLIMYIGSAALATAAIRKAKEYNNPLMSACATGTGAMLSIGAGKMASGIFNKVVDRTVDFIDDVGMKDKESKKNEENSMASTVAPE